MWSWPRIKRQKWLLNPQEHVMWGHISVRPTQLGINLLLIALCIWLAALNYAVNLAYGLCFWILSTLLVACLFSMRQLLGLKIHLTLPSEVFAGDTGVLTVTLQSNDLRHRRLLVRLVDDESASAALSKDDLNVLHSHTDGMREVALPIATVRRGYETIPYLQLISTAPFGLLEVSVVCASEETFLVYPAPLEHVVETVSGRLTEDESMGQRQQGGDEVAYLKQFVDGHSLQSIAWKQYAKTGQLLSKHFEYPAASVPNIISYKDYPNVHSPDRLASFLCQRVLQQEKAHQNYILELPNQTIASTVQQKQLCLNALAVM